MVKKRATKQNIAIIVLSILLLLSIVFGSTYSYFNGHSDSVTSGIITTATLNVELRGYDEEKEESSSFSLHTGSDAVVPGQPLKNTQLQIKNTSPVDTYMMVLYTLSIVDSETQEEIDTTTEGDKAVDPSTLEVLQLDPNATGVEWNICNWDCKDGKTKLCMLIYLGNTFNGSTTPAGEGDGIFPASSKTGNDTTLVLHSNCLRVPTSWENNMQGRTIQVTFQAYVLQSQALGEAYGDLSNANKDIRTREIARAMVTEFELDKTQAS